jgi:hypothetical protein
MRGGKNQHLGRFDDERDAARAVDTAARRLRGEDAHGGLGGKKGQIWRLNFPTQREVERAQQRGALPVEEGNAAAAAVSERQEPWQSCIVFREQNHTSPLFLPSVGRSALNNTCVQTSGQCLPGSIQVSGIIMLHLCFSIII